MPVHVTFGEVLLRLSASGAERLFQSPELRTYWGGPEANVAMSLGTLGVPVRHVTCVPNTALGDAAVRALITEGVDTRDVRRTEGRLGLFFVEPGAGPRPMQVTFDRAHSAFATLDPGQFDWKTILADASWLHVSGTTPALGEGPLRAVAEALATARRLGVRTSFELDFDPTLWQGRNPQPLIASLATHVQLLIGNPEALHTMLADHPSSGGTDNPEAIARTVLRVHEQFGCSRILVTQREVESATLHRWRAHGWEADAETFTSTPWHQVTVVDRVGGEESFIAAYLYAQRSGQPMAHALHFATAASILKLSIPGEVNRVTAREIDAFLSTLPH